MCAHVKKWGTGRGAIIAGVTRLLPLSLALVSCQGSPSPPPEYAERAHPLAAFCVAPVDGTGPVDVEADYVPRVVACENGGADFEALRAQAVAARSYLYYKLETSGRIGDGQHDQVYSCRRAPGPEHFRAAESTAGQVLRYRGETLAAFYVSGAIPSADDCVARAGDEDPHGTERYVTYNRGRSGDDIEQTTLGWVNLRNLRNRGCKSQNGANCLSQHGVGYRDILTFYYGEDIELVRADGPCVMGGEGPPPGCPSIEAEAVIEEDGGCFARRCATGEWWTDVAAGHGGHHLTTGTIDRPEPDCVGRWRLDLGVAGRYEVAAYVTDVGGSLTRRARYNIRHAGQDASVEIDQRGRDGWVPLGTFDFEAGGEQWVELPDNTGEPYNEGGVRIAYDAVRVGRAEIPSPDAAPPRPDAAPESPPDGGIDGVAPPADAGPAESAVADLGSLDLAARRDAGATGVTKAALSGDGCGLGGSVGALWWVLLGIRRRGYR